MPSLTVFCAQGLGNRLRVLLSALIVAEATGRRFKMLWPVNRSCGAPFAALFANPWPVETVAESDVLHLHTIRGWFDPLPDLLADERGEIVFGYPDWLLQPKRFPHHAELLSRSHALANELRLVPHLQQAVDQFKANHFRPQMIGVHVRRGDMVRERPDALGNTEEAVAAVDRFLERYPEAGILLCTDDGAVDPKFRRESRPEGVRGLFRRRYGERVVWTTPRSLDRLDSLAIQDALVELWLLRATDCFVGSQVSSFSDFAVVGRDCPSVQLSGPDASYRRWERMARLTGLHALLTAWGRRWAGRELPFPVIVRYLANTPRAWAKRGVRRRFPILYQRLKAFRSQWREGRGSSGGHRP